MNIKQIIEKYTLHDPWGCSFIDSDVFTDFEKDLTKLMKEDAIEFGRFCVLMPESLYKQNLNNEQLYDRFKLEQSIEIKDGEWNG